MLLFSLKNGVLYTSLGRKWYVSLDLGEIWLESDNWLSISNKHTCFRPAAIASPQFPIQHVNMREFSQ